MKKAVTIFSPATIANVGPGFDILGFAIDQPGDIMSLEITGGKSHRIINKTPFDLPLDPDINAATVSLSAFLEHIESKEKLLLPFLKRSSQEAVLDPVLPVQPDLCLPQTCC